MCVMSCVLTSEFDVFTQLDCVTFDFRHNLFYVPPIRSELYGKFRRCN